ncbi:MAG: signal recognition particle-docking protein FtsY [bacterium]|nr:signal recognition particle-docking protein FtsY [bacterium]
MAWLMRWWRRRRSSVPEQRAVVDPTVSALAKTRRALMAALRSAGGDERLNAAFWSGLEEALVASDLGVEISAELVSAVRSRQPADRAGARELLAEEMIGLLGDADRSLAWSGNGSPRVVMVVGVNGAGKTTTSAKLAHRLASEGRDCLLGAADTHRPAAQSQLATWAERMGVEIVGGEDGADPAAVARDAWTAAKSRGHEVVVIDTAGRLHAKTHLMSQLEKMKRVLTKVAGRVDEVLLVLDASTGQNGVAQAREFCERVGVTGVVLTKLDGTARGGVAVAVERLLGTPVKLVGTGEGLSDLAAFDAGTFVRGLLEDGPR